MTCLEKFMEENADSVIATTGEPVSEGYVLEFLCPSEHMDIDDPEWCFSKENNDINKCKTCWNREFPEEKIRGKRAGATLYEDGTVDKETVDAVITPFVSGNSGPTIKDSGNRREFETGAVRDIQEGKGRCDLLPLDVVAEFYQRYCCDGQPTEIFKKINEFCTTGEALYLYRVVDLSCFIFDETGSFSTLFLEVSKHFEEGCKKYGENNWQKGIPTHCYIDSAVRHYLKYLRGDTDEPHDRAFVWNILCCIWTCIHKPELNDYAKKEE